MINSFKNYEKSVRFSDLAESVQHCDLCDRMRERRKVLSSANGTIQSKVLFIAEAPGRFGADRTGIPLYGDRTGDNFESLLGNIGWRREDIFITNAVLCNPKQENGNNDKPTANEIANCSAYLEMVIALVSPDVIVTLGTTALFALNLLTPHGIELRQGVARLVPWCNYLLFPLYHPGSRAMVHRSRAKQRSDFMILSKIVHPLEGLIERKKARIKRKSKSTMGNTIMQQVARVLLELGGRMTYFKMTKLMYMIDLACLRKIGHTVASPIYLRQVEGPWPPDLDKALQDMQGYEVRRFYRRRIPMVAPGPSSRFDISLGDDIITIISDVFHTYGAMNNAEIKTAVYRTEPMRFILFQEGKGKKMVNKPVIYKDKTAKELTENDTYNKDIE